MEKGQFSILTAAAVTKNPSKIRAYKDLEVSVGVSKEVQALMWMLVSTANANNLVELVVKEGAAAEGDTVVTTSLDLSTVLNSTVVGDNFLITWTWFRSIHPRFRRLNC